MRRRALFALLALAACETASGPQPPGAAISAPDSILVIEGDSARIAATVLDSANRAIDAPIVWISEDSLVASVTRDGVVRFGRPGRTSVIALADGLVRRVAVRTAIRVSQIAIRSSDANLGWCTISTRDRLYCYEPYQQTRARLDSLAPIATPGGAGVASIALGGSYGCGMTTDHQPFCWGVSGYLMGFPDLTVFRDTMLEPPGVPAIAQLAAGYGHTCAASIAGVGWCWGLNDFGVLGRGDSMYGAKVPAPIAGSHVMASMGAGIFHSCGIDSAGAAWCWGTNSNGELGNANLALKRTAAPVAVAGGHAFVTIAAANDFSCALATDGTQWCWGYRPGSRNNPPPAAPCLYFPCYNVPVQASTRQFSSLSVGGSIWSALVCGISAGAAWCWGDNASGQVGDGTTVDRLSPVQVPLPAAARSVSAGDGAACAVLVTDEAWCWGAGFGMTPRRLPWQP